MRRPFRSTINALNVYQSYKTRNILTVALNGLRVGGCREHCESEYAGPSVTLWRRATYAYNTLGDLYTAAYNGGTPATPGISYLYDRRGRLRTVDRNGMQATLGYTSPKTSAL